MQVEKLKTIDADTLLSTPMRKTLFVVDGLIPQGLSVLSGSSKPASCKRRSAETNSGVAGAQRFFYHR